MCFRRPSDSGTVYSEENEQESLEKDTSASESLLLAILAKQSLRPTQPAHKPVALVPITLKLDTPTRWT